MTPARASWARCSARCTSTTCWSTPRPPTEPRGSRRSSAARPRATRVTTPPTAERDLRSYRDEFAVLERKTYLISASLGPVSRRSQDYLSEYIDARATKGAPDHVWLEDIFPRMAALKRSFSALDGCDADEVAITTNISIALATIASALDLTGPRRRVILSELDFPTDGHVWLAWAAKTGAE